MIYRKNTNQKVEHKSISNGFEYLNINGKNLMLNNQNQKSLKNFVEEFQ